MHVTCEVTPHFLVEETSGAIQVLCNFFQEIGQPPTLW